MKRRDYIKIESIDQVFQESHKIQQTNKTIVERQNVDVMIHNGTDPKPAERSTFPKHDGVRPQDNRGLYHSLKRSYLKMGDRQ